MKFSLGLLLLVSSHLYANDFMSLQRERIHQAYLKNNQRVDIDCKVHDQSYNLKSITDLSETKFVKNSSIQKSFRLSNYQNEFLDFEITVRPDANKGSYQINYLNDSALSEMGSIQTSVTYNAENFNFKNKKEIRFSSSSYLYTKWRLADVRCHVEFAFNKKVNISDDNNQYHISVHPHSFYDLRNLLTRPINRYLENPNYQSLVLLEDKNGPDVFVDVNDFLRTGKTNIKMFNFDKVLVKIPLRADLVVSPAGHNRYLYSTKKEVTVTYTGGNHNYCIWNNTRNLLKAYFQGSSDAPLNINYDLNAIVVQRRGIRGNLSMGRREFRKTNLLGKLFQLNSSRAQRYHSDYFSYFSGVHNSPFRDHFSQLVISYHSQHFSKKVVIKGSGKRKLRVNFNYLPYTGR